MQKYKILAIFVFLLLSFKVINAEEHNYITIFSDSVLTNHINSVKYDDVNDVLYVNGMLANKESNNNFSFEIDGNKITFTYDEATTKINVSYLRPKGTYFDIVVKVTNSLNKPTLYVNDGKQSKYYQGFQKDNIIDFGNVSIYNKDNKFESFSVYLDTDKKEIIFKDKNEYNFKVNQNADTILKIVLDGKVNENKIYAISDPTNSAAAINGIISDDRINSYLKDYFVELKNDEFSISKSYQLEKIMEKWTKTSNDSFNKESVVVACTNKDYECEVYPKTAYLIRDYHYQDIEEDSDNLVDGSSSTPMNLRVYDSDYIYSEYLPIKENLETIKQERDVIKEYKNWSAYKSEPCVENDDKKCRYKTFYTKYTYKLISSTPLYSDYMLQKDLLANPIETTELEYTTGPYLNCTKYEETVMEHQGTQCLARDNSVHLYAVQCKDDTRYTQLCMADEAVKRTQTYSLEPIDEANRAWCSQCTVNRSYPLETDEQGRKYATISVLGTKKDFYVPDGNCIEVKDTSYTEVIRGQCLERAMLYNHYKREYLGENNIYSETPTIQHDLESCSETENKIDGIVRCEEDVKSSYSNAEYRYSEWVDVVNFSNLINKEKRYKYRTFKTYGTKVIEKNISENEYSEDEIKCIEKEIAMAKSRIQESNNQKEYYLLKEAEKSDSFISIYNKNLSLIKSESIFAPVIHVLNKDINSLDSIAIKNYEGSKIVDQYFEGVYIPINEMIERELTKELESKVVFFDKTSKIKDYDNWKDNKELIEKLDEIQNVEPQFEVTLNRLDLIRLKNWRKQNLNNKECELIREFSGVVKSPSNLNDLLAKTTGCEIKR